MGAVRRWAGGSVFLERVWRSSALSLTCWPYARDTDSQCRVVAVYRGWTVAGEDLERSRAQKTTAKRDPSGIGFFPMSGIKKKHYLRKEKERAPPPTPTPRRPRAAPRLTVRRVATGMCINT